jgi:hypothetical protein
MTSPAMCSACRSARERTTVLPAPRVGTLVPGASAPGPKPDVTSERPRGQREDNCPARMRFERCGWWRPSTSRIVPETERIESDCV